MIKRQENETTLYGNSTGLQGRALINDSVLKIQEIEARGGTLAEMMPHMTGEHGDRIWKEGKMDQGLINVGQSIGLIHDIPTCRELIEGIVREAEEIIGQVKAKF
jgi:nitronate monooxygenase